MNSIFENKIIIRFLSMSRAMEGYSELMNGKIKKCLLTLTPHPSSLPWCTGRCSLLLVHSGHSFHMNFFHIHHHFMALNPKTLNPKLSQLYVRNY